MDHFGKQTVVINQITQQLSKKLPLPNSTLFN